MWKKKNSLLPLFLSIAILFSACNTKIVDTPVQAQQSTPYTLVDALGREVTFQQPPTRIVLVGKMLFAIADALYLFPDAPSRIAAIGDTDQGGGNFIALIDPDYPSKAVLGADAGAEQVAAFQPDAVILKSYLAQSLGASIEALGIPVVYVEFETPQQYERDLQIIGQMLQEEKRAAEIASLYQARLQQVADGLAGLEETEKPRTLLLYYSDKDGAVAFNVPPMSWMQTVLVEMAGGNPVWKDANLGSGWSTLTVEQIAAWDPDKIFVITYVSSSSDAVAVLKQDSNWELLRAVQEDQLYAFPADQYSWDQPDPRWILGLQWLAGRLHPDRFTNQDMIEEVRTFYETFYELDAQFFEEKILPAIKGDLR